MHHITRRFGDIGAGQPKTVGIPVDYRIRTAGSGDPSGEGSA